MFVRLQNHIINVEEIQIAKMEEIRKGKFNITITFKNSTNNVYFYNLGLEEAEATFYLINEACLNYKKN